MFDIGVSDVIANVSNINANVVALPCQMPLATSELEWIGQPCELNHKQDFRGELVQSNGLNEFYVRSNVMPRDGWSNESSVDVGYSVFNLDDEIVCHSEPSDPTTDLRSCANHRVRPDICKPPNVL